MEELSTLVIAVVLLTYALFSQLLHRWRVSMPAAMLIVGTLLGVSGLRLLELEATSEAVKFVAEITLALMLFHDACRIGFAKLRGQMALPGRLLGFGLPVMVALGIVLAYAFFPSEGWIAAALAATMLAPTDAALGEEVVTDTRLPGWLRQGLNVESGLNDGLSVPIFLVLLGVAATHEPEGAGLISEFARVIGFGVLGGAMFGGGGGMLVRLARERGRMFGEWVRYAVLAIALASFVSAALMGGSGFIGAFVGGLFFGTSSRQEGAEALGLTNHLGTAFDAVAFVLLGAVLVPLALDVITWRIVVYALLSLVLVRPIAVSVAMLGSRAAWQTVVFMGWFDPRGLATVVFAVLLLEAEIPGGDQVAAIAVTGVVWSVFAHGFSAQGLVDRYARWFGGATGTRHMPEHDDVNQPSTRGYQGLASRRHAPSRVQGEREP